MQHDYDEDAKKYAESVMQIEELRRKQMEHNRHVEAKNVILTDANSNHEVTISNLNTQLQAMITELADEKAAHTATKASLDNLQAAHEELKIELLAINSSLSEIKVLLHVAPEEQDRQRVQIEEVNNLLATHQMRMVSLSEGL